MANTIKNLSGKHFTDEEMNISIGFLKQFEQSLRDVLVNISAAERRKYGRVNEQNRLFINKIFDFFKNNRELSSPDIDWSEFEKDYESRANLETVIMTLQNILDGLVNAKTLFDYDNYQAALDDYSYTMYKARTSIHGFENKYKEIKKFFPRSRKKKTEDKKES